MVTTKQYIDKKTGKKYWGFQEYLGTDPITQKRVRVNRREDKYGRRFKTEKQAKIEAARLKLQFEEGMFQKTTTESYQNIKTFEDLFLLWWKNRYVGSVKKSTLKSTRSIFRRQILPRFGHLNIKKINKIQCEALANEMIQTEHSQANVWLTYINRILDYAVYLELITKNPMKSAYYSKKRPKKKRKTPFYSAEELNQFLECSKYYGNGRKWFSMFHLIAYTGMRNSETLALRWSDINFEEQTINITKTLVQVDAPNQKLSFDTISKKVITESDTTKNNTHRVIHIDDNTLAVLKEWRTFQRQYFLKKGMNTLNPDQLVFSNEKNKWIELRSPSHAIKRIVKRDNLNHMTTHGLRHTHCSLLFEAGRTITEVQNRLGHKTTRVTLEVYAHVTSSLKEKETATAFKDLMNR